MCSGNSKLVQLNNASHKMITEYWLLTGNDQ